MPSHPHRFRGKLIAGALAPLVIAGALQALYSVVSQRREAIAGLEVKAAALTNLLVNVVGPSIALDDPQGIDEGFGYLEGDPDFEFALAVAPDGKLLGFRGPGHTRDARLAAAAITDHPVVSQIQDTLIASYPVMSRNRQIAQLLVGLHTAAASTQAGKLTAWSAAISLVGIAAAVAVVLVLAGRIARRNREMADLLDNVEQGFLHMNRDGTLAAERSAMAARLLGGHHPGQRLWDALAPLDPGTAAWLELAWASVLEGELPLELTLDQLPRRLAIGDRSYRIEYRPTITHDSIGRTLVVITEKTAELARERAEASERDLLRMVERMARDRAGFVEFVDETDRLIHRINAAPAISDAFRRDLHSLKGNCAVYGLTQITQWSHDLEDRLAGSFSIDTDIVQSIVLAWSDLKAKLDRVFGDAQAAASDVGADDLAELKSAIARGATLAKIERLVKGWSLERTRPRLERFAEQAQALAGRLGKGDVVVAIADHKVRVDPVKFRPFWTAFPHAVRNAIDHGIEPSASRVAAGKPEYGRIDLITRRDGSALVIELRDDGAGIDWDKIRDRARDASRPHATRDDLVAALLSDGITTRSDASETSGRGLGLAALRDAVAGIGGKIEVDSEPGRGTGFRFRFEREAGARSTSRIPRLVVEPLTD